MVFIAIFAPYLGTVDPTIVAIKKRILEPSAVYWFGTDMLGRDLYSRVMFGARASLIVGFSVAMVSTIIGTFVGLISGSVRVTRQRRDADYRRTDVDSADPPRNSIDGTHSGVHTECGPRN